MNRNSEGNLYNPLKAGERRDTLTHMRLRPTLPWHALWKRSKQSLLSLYSFLDQTQAVLFEKYRSMARVMLKVKGFETLFLCSFYEQTRTDTPWHDLWKRSKHKLLVAFSILDHTQVDSSSELEISIK